MLFYHFCIGPVIGPKISYNTPVISTKLANTFEASMELNIKWLHQLYIFTKTINISVPFKLKQEKNCPRICWSIQEYVGQYKNMLVNTGMCWPIQEYVGQYKKVLANTRICWSIQECVGQYNNMLANTRMCWPIQEYVGQYKNVLVNTGMYWPIQEYVGQYKNVLVNTRIYWSIWYIGGLYYTDWYFYTAIKNNCLSIDN